ncbi:hypothetical protein JY96_16150 [Aquabacterium sp. NJ1]|uniref:lipopolysaccharide heptosyltransferase I n=1 Tax=Aquabacterium sp. NJ1 TaxID=1538295 RepID=UPI00052C2DD8|nr:lipopolysaccharide heptosyltransferase I [Aquabacterium sp. NJ1]KGM41067.1 hypothetical protein JY96_16150 [Aquabacterium sp. NJ1]
MRILIVKTSSMGDVVHAMPAISDIANALPDAQVDWVVEKSFASIPLQHRAVNRVIPLQWRKWRKSLRSPETRAAIRTWRMEMAREPYDLIIDMQGLLKSALFACFARGPVAGYDFHSIREPLASLFYRRRASISLELHAVDRCRRLAAQVLGYTAPNTPPDFGLRAKPDGWTPSPHAPFGVLIPCASRPEKLWPEDDWVAIGTRMRSHGWQVAIMWGSPDELSLAQRLAEKIGAVVPPFLTVAQVADTLSKAQAVVGLDTGMSHLAAAHGRPVVGIYCDHEPGLAGLKGSGPVISLGGKGIVPARLDVLQALESVIASQNKIGRLV